MEAPEIENYPDEDYIENNNIFKDCLCPIKQEIMKDPVCTSARNKK